MDIKNSASTSYFGNDGTTVEQGHAGLLGSTVWPSIRLLGPKTSRLVGLGNWRPTIIQTLGLEVPKPLRFFCG